LFISNYYSGLERLKKSRTFRLSRRNAASTEATDVCDVVSPVK